MILPLMISFFCAFLPSISINNTKLIPSGENILFEIKPDGVIVTGFYDVKDENRYYNPSIHSDICKGDLIKKVNGKKISSLDSFLLEFRNSDEKNEVQVSLIRDNRLLERSIRLIKTNSTLKTGLFVKERVLGIGTLTYIDPVTKYYGALGHEVIDPDMNKEIEVNEGSIYRSSVISISKGEKGSPGEKLSSTEMDFTLGDVEENTKYGIFGTVDELPKSYVALDICPIDKIKIGKASFLTCTNKNEVKSYSLEITSIKKNEETKGISFKITDKEIIEKYGGVYSGMSGSPIIQDNTLIGAITHVSIQNPVNGYGIFMETMYSRMMANLNQ